MAQPIRLYTSIQLCIYRSHVETCVDFVNDRIIYFSRDDHEIILAPNANITELTPPPFLRQATMSL